MKDKQQILLYLSENPFIIPAKMIGGTYLGKIWPAELSKRCRELRKAGILTSEPYGKFEMFKLADYRKMESKIVLPPAREKTGVQNKLI